MTITKNEKETYVLAGKIAENLKNGGILYLIGDLGTGKTTFTKGLAEFLGINSFSIKSPTYTYIRKHKTKNQKHLYHIDLYRLDTVDELLWNEIKELMENKSNIIIIEWADRIDKNLRRKGITVNFKYLGENKREISLKEPLKNYVT